MKRLWMFIAMLTLMVCCMPFPTSATEPGTQPKNFQQQTGDTVAQPSEPAATPAIQISEANFNFGEAEEGSAITHEYKVQNTGGAVLEISRVRPG